MSSGRPDWIHRHFIHMASGIAIAIGVLLILWGSGLGGSQKDIVIGIGISFVTAGIIEGTLEIVFITRIAREVFEIAFGYILHPSIREEIRWLYGMERLASSYTHSFKFQKCDDNPEKVWLLETVNRIVENISSKAIEITLPGYGIQEWFHREGQSDIFSLKITHEDGEVLYSSEKSSIGLSRPETKQGNYILTTSTDNLKRKLEPGKKYTWVIASKELRPKNADTVFWSAIASNKPNVRVEIIEGMDYDLTFGNRKQGELKDLGSGEWRLDSLLLPGQALRLRWWVKDDSEKWKGEFDEKQSKQSNQEGL